MYMHGRAPSWNSLTSPHATHSRMLTPPQGEVIVKAALPPHGGPVHQVTFHPHNANLLCTTGRAGGVVGGISSGAAGGEGGSPVGPPLAWRLDKLWGRHEATFAAIEVPEGLGEPTCHAWFPQVGKLGGEGDRQRGHRARMWAGGRVKL